MHRNADDSKKVELFLGERERAAFVEVLLKLIDRGQYSKNESLADTVAAATSILAYVEPSLVLPFVASRFHLALETVSTVNCIISLNSKLSYFLGLRGIGHFKPFFFPVYLFICL